MTYHPTTISGRPVCFSMSSILAWNTGSTASTLTPYRAREIEVMSCHKETNTHTVTWLCPGYFTIANTTEYTGSNYGIYHKQCYMYKTCYITSSVPRLSPSRVNIDWLTFAPKLATCMHVEDSLGIRLLHHSLHYKPC